MANLSVKKKVKNKDTDEKVRVRRTAGFYDDKYTGSEVPWSIDDAALEDHEYQNKIIRSLNYYNYHYSIKDAQKWLVEYFKLHKDVWTPERVSKLSKVMDLIPMTVFSLAKLSNMEAPLRPSNLEWFNSRLVEFEGRASKDEPDEEKAETKPTVSIQDRVRDTALVMAAGIDDAIDDFFQNPNTYDLKSVKPVNLLKVAQAKGAHARIIKGFYADEQERFIELVEGDSKSDEWKELSEGYANLNKVQRKHFLEFLRNIESACDIIIGEAKTVSKRKPKAKKAKPAEELVKKLKFKASDTTLGIVSVPPAKIIGASQIWVYNSKTRKLGCYNALADSVGLSVKGTSITQFNEDTSVQKTLRKPLEQLRDSKDLSRTKMIKWFKDDVKTTDTKMNGRFSEDIIIFKIL